MGDFDNVLLFFGGIAGGVFLVVVLAVCLDHRRKMRERQLGHLERLKALETGKWLDAADAQRQVAHLERMKALEKGLPLPDADIARSTALATIGVLVPLFMAAAAAGGTALVYLWSSEAPQVLLYVIWGVAGLVSLVTVTTCLPLIARVRPGEDLDSQPEAETPEGADKGKAAERLPQG
jgi:hypothetical protein